MCDTYSSLVIVRNANDYVLGDKVSRESVDVGRHFVDSKTDGVHGSVESRTRATATSPVAIAVATGTSAGADFLLFPEKEKSVTGLVVLRHRHHDVALGTGGGRPRDLDEELWVHGRRLCLNFHIKRRKRQRKKEKNQSNGIR